MSRKTDAIQVAIQCVKACGGDSYKEILARQDVIHVLDEAEQYFMEQDKQEQITMKDYYPVGYREPICSECCMYDDIRNEVIEEMDVIAEANGVDCE